MRRASFVQRLAANPFEQAFHQVDRVVAALAAIFTSHIRLHPDDLIATLVIVTYRGRYPPPVGAGIARPARR